MQCLFAEATKQREVIGESIQHNNVEEVAQAYFSAIFGSHPRLTYYLGKKVPIQEFMKSLPDYLYLTIMERMMD